MRHFKYIVLTVVFSVISVPSWADFKLARDLNFALDTPTLEHGDVQMYMSLTDPAKLEGSRFQVLDTRNDAKQDADKVLMSRFAFVVPKDVSFFQTREMISKDRTLKLLPPGSELTAIGPDTYRTRLPHPNPFAKDVRNQMHLSYLASPSEVRSNKDAQDLIRRMPDGQAKPNAMMVQDLSGFNEYFKSGANVIRYYSAGCGKTLVTTDSLMILRRGGLDEIESDAMGMMTAEAALNKQARDQISRVIEVLTQLR